MRTYTIHTNVVGFEADNEQFTEFLEMAAASFGRLFNYENSVDTPDVFTIQVPGDTNFFMLGMLWTSYKNANAIQ